MDFTGLSVLALGRLGVSSLRIKAGESGSGAQESESDLDTVSTTSHSRWVVLVFCQIFYRGIAVVVPGDTSDSPARLD